MPSTDNTSAAVRPPPQRPELRRQLTHSVQVVPEYRKKVIKTMNEQEAKKKNGVTLLIPQPSPYGHARTYHDYRWTDIERSRSNIDGTLPSNSDTVPSNLAPAPIGMWIFDGRGSTNTSMPEVEVDPVPDLERNRAIVVVDFGIPEYLCMIPPGLCRLVATTPGKARLAMNAFTATHPNGAQEYFPAE